MFPDPLEIKLDRPDEIYIQYIAFHTMHGRVLVGGLGLGMAANMIAAMPGGIEGVRQLVAEFHQHGVRVLFPMLMWDQGFEATPDSA